MRNQSFFLLCFLCNPIASLEKEAKFKADYDCYERAKNIIEGCDIFPTVITHIVLSYLRRVPLKSWPTTKRVEGITCGSAPDEVLSIDDEHIITWKNGKKIKTEGVPCNVPFQESDPTLSPLRYTCFNNNFIHYKGNLVTLWRPRGYPSAMQQALAYLGTQQVDRILWDQRLCSPFYISPRLTLLIADSSTNDWDIVAYNYVTGGERVSGAFKIDRTSHFDINSYNNSMTLCQKDEFIGLTDCNKHTLNIRHMTNPKVKIDINFESQGDKWGPYSIALYSHDDKVSVVLASKSSILRFYEYQTFYENQTLNPYRNHTFTTCTQQHQLPSLCEQMGEPRGSLQFSSDGNYVVAVRHNRVFIFDRHAEKGTPPTYIVRPSSIHALCIDDNNTIAVTDGDGTEITLYEI